MELEWIFIEALFCTVRLALAHALEEVAVIVEALLAVALVARQRVLTVTLLADFISKQRALIDICRRKMSSQKQANAGGIIGNCCL